MEQGVQLRAQCHWGAQFPGLGNHFLAGLGREVTHRLNEWRSSEPNEDKLCDRMRAKMEKFVVKFVEGGVREKN